MARWFIDVTSFRPHSGHVSTEWWHPPPSGGLLALGPDMCACIVYMPLRGSNTSTSTWCMAYRGFEIQLGHVVAPAPKVLVLCTSAGTEGAGPWHIVPVAGTCTWCIAPAPLHGARPKALVHGAWQNKTCWNQFISTEGAGAGHCTWCFAPLLAPWCRVPLGTMYLQVPCTCSASNSTTSRHFVPAWCLCWANGPQQRPCSSK